MVIPRIFFTIWPDDEEGGYWLETFDKDGKELRLPTEGKTYPTASAARSAILKYDRNSTEIEPK